jgi:hypothetical protein
MNRAGFLTAGTESSMESLLFNHIRLLGLADRMIICVHHQFKKIYGYAIQ